MAICLPRLPSRPCHLPESPALACHPSLRALTAFLCAECISSDPCPAQPNTCPAYPLPMCSHGPPPSLHRFLPGSSVTCLENLTLPSPPNGHAGEQSPKLHLPRPPRRSPWRLPRAEHCSWHKAGVPQMLAELKPLCGCSFLSWSLICSHSGSQSRLGQAPSVVAQTWSSQEGPASLASMGSI